METIKIAYGNQFTIFIPFVLLDGDDETVLDASTLTDVVVKVGKACNWVTKTHTIADEKIAVTFDATTAVGYYDFVITAKYNGRDVAARPQQVFAVVEWNDESNFCDFIFGGECIAPTQAVIGEYVTTAELEALKVQLQTKIAAAEAAKEEAEEAKEEWQEKAEALDDVATETNATANKQAILDAIDEIDIDTSTLAKQGTDSTATLTAVQTETDKIGTAASGQASTLFGAIAEIAGGGTTIYSEYPVVNMTATTASLDSNKMYIWGEVSSLTISLNAPTDTTIANVYYFEFVSGATATTLSLPSSVTIRGAVGTNKMYNVAIVNNIAYIA